MVDTTLVARYETELMPRANLCYQEDRAETRRERRRQERQLRQELFAEAKKKNFASAGASIFWLFLTNPELWKAILNLVSLIRNTLNQHNPPMSLPNL